MTDAQRNKGDMYKLIRQLFIDNPDITIKWKDFALCFVAFSAYIDDIDAIAKKQKQALDGEVKAKTKNRKDLITTLIALSDQCTAYARVKEDVDLLAKVLLGTSKLRALPDAELVSKALVFLDDVKALLPKLDGYDITTADLDAAILQTQVYNKAYLKPKGDKQQVSSFTAQLDGIFKANDKELVKIGSIVKAGGKKDPAFYAEYLMKRKISKVGRGKRAFECWLIDSATGVVLPNFLIKVHLVGEEQLKKNIRKSGKKGGTFINNLAAGEYVYEISHLGYVVATGKFYITSGEMTKIVVKMSKG